MKPIPVIIPARGGSKGIPRKNVLPLCGKPLIGYAIEAALGCPEVSSVWVSTDSHEISEVARRFGARVIERPAELATDEASSESALLHALEVIEAIGSLPEAFCFVQCTSPLVCDRDLSRGIRRFYDKQADSLLSVCLSHRFLWKEGGEGLIGVNHDASVRLRRQELPPEYAENGAFYIMRTSPFRLCKHRFFGRIEASVMDSRSAIEIDDLEDFKLVEQLMSSNHPSRTDVSGIRAVVFDFDGVFTDDRVWVDENGVESAVCSRSDGMGISMLRDVFDGPLLILSREVNPIVRHRAKKLGLECLHGIEDKLAVLSRWAESQSLALSEIAYIGNDLNDDECLRNVGLAVVPSDAHSALKPQAHWVLSRCGGRGAVREFCDRLLGESAHF